MRGRRGEPGSSALGTQPPIRDPRCPAAGPIASLRLQRAPGSNGAPGTARGLIRPPPRNFASRRALLPPVPLRVVSPSFGVVWGKIPSSEELQTHPPRPATHTLFPLPPAPAPLRGDETLIPSWYWQEKFGSVPRPRGREGSRGGGNGGPSLYPGMYEGVPRSRRGSVPPGPCLSPGKKSE